MENRIIPESIIKRIPLFKVEWLELYKKMGGHAHAPVWNTECGDRLTEDDMMFIQSFTHNLRTKRGLFLSAPPEWLIKWSASLKENSSWFRQKINSDNIKEIWESIAPMTRSDMQSSLELIVPENADLSRLIINPTSGTTGHPIPAPNHPCAVGCYDPMIQYALERHGVTSDYNSSRVAAVQICSQKKTITYHTVHSYLNGAGFAKVNLPQENWKSVDSANIYINDMKPVFLSGDPFSS